MRKSVPIVVFIAQFLFLACNLGPTRPTEEFEMTQEQWDFFYPNARWRANKWFCKDQANVPGDVVRGCENMPENFPTQEEMQARRWTWHADANWGQTCTCTHGADWSTVRIPNGELEGGCTQHEMLHAALYFIDHPCKSEIEHPANGSYATSRCKKGY